MNTTTQTTWPEGVIGRYINIGGATVDVILSTDRTLAQASCTGETCNATHRPFDYEGHFLDSGYSPVEAAQMAVDSSREDAAKWAQAHAEKCRAMPLPGGAR
jgi:hypothetical protein